MAPRVLLLLAGLGLLSAGLTARAEDGDKASPRTSVTLQAESEPVLSVLKRLCISHGYNFVADDAALQRAGKVSLSLTDVSFDDALEAICDAYGLEGRVRGLDAHPIVVIRLRQTDRSDSHERLISDERPAGSSARPSGNRFLEGVGPGVLRVERTPASTSAPTPNAPAAVATQTPAQNVPSAPAPPAPVAAVPSAAPRTSGAIVVGIVVEIGAESVTLKENTGDPRAFLVPSADSDALRNERLTRGLSHLKKGDRVCLEYRSDSGRLFILNLVGGGKPVENP